MRWTPGDRGNIEDARGGSGFRMGGGVVPIGLGGLILLALFSWLTGTNFLSLLNSTEQPAPTDQSSPVASSPAEEREVDFVDAMMKDIQTTWQMLLPGYRPTRVVLFRDVIQSSCGMAESATGPFYCPQDQRVYLDLGFFQEMSQRLGAPGEFARAYVIAHEVGHHVQRLAGILGSGTTPHRSGSSCRPIASRASGAITRRNRAARRKAKWSSRRATWSRG